MSNGLQLKALLKKNLILMKRNWCSTLCEIVFPIVLMLLLVAVRGLIKIEEDKFDYTDEIYLRNQSAAMVSSDKLDQLLSQDNSLFWNDMQYRNPLLSCNFFRRNSTNLVAIVSLKEHFEPLSKKINKFKLLKDIEFKQFNSKDGLFDYVADIRYGQISDFPEICFGVSFFKNDNLSYNISLHFYDTNVLNKIREIPTSTIPALDPFKKGADMESYKLWINSGFLQMQQLLNEYILQDITKNPNAELSYGFMPEKYDIVYNDKFGLFLGPILCFFLIVAYLAPLCILVFRMVQEKESRAKEGMKIMGLSTFIYFLSFFVYWLILNTIYSIINAFILTKVLKYISFIYIFVFLWLFGMTIFAFAYTLQATLNRTRVAIIMTVLLYFTMYFISAAVLQQEIYQGVKIILSLMPPTALGFGLLTMAQFDSNQVNFGWDQLNIRYFNYSVGNMYAMLSIDILLYLFLGYYLENVLPQQFGLKKKFYFLCTKSFWCKKRLSRNLQKKSSVFPKNDLYSSDTNKKNLEENLISDNSDKLHRESLDKSRERLSIRQKSSSSDNFQPEEIYQGKIEAGECLQIKNLKKIFDDGKVAVDGLSLNIYQNEIFALLGHNGAGKSTTISILTGLYEASSGEAIYDGDNILEEEKMSEIRKNLGICPQNDVLFNNLSVQEHLEMFSVFKGIPADKIEGEVNKILSELYFDNKRNTLANFLSGGEKRKLSIAIALIGGSKIVFLDEPSSGMDITSRRNLWEILKKCCSERIIVLTTHYMEEAAVLGNRIGIMSNGQLKCCGNSLFLIDKFGKYVSLNIFKKSKANNQDIVQFVKRTLKEKFTSFKNEEILDDIETEVLSEEILIRIPKTNDFSFKIFFEEFDKNLKVLNIKNYEASMPSLEDVFLNVTAETHSNISSGFNPESKKSDNNEVDLLKDLNKQGTFYDQFLALFVKRIVNIIRDKKSFLLEIIVPFFLVLIGLLISSVQFFKNSPGIENTIESLPSPENIITGKYQVFNNETVDNCFLSSIKQEIITFPNDVNLTSFKSNLIDFNNYIYNNQKKPNNFGNYLFFNIDNTTKTFKFGAFLNTNSRYAPVIFAQYLTNKILSYAAGAEVTINSFTEPVPLTDEVKNQGQARNTSNLVFFVSVAFALIPANFITIIIRERETNNKHLQLLSGVSKFNYWLSNYVFELLKYYIVAGLIAIVIWAFDDFVRYFYIFYLVYGPSMIVFTYFLSFVFEDESSGQNGVILLNFLLGTLAGNVVLILRVLPDTTSTGKLLANIFRIIPSFSLTYGYSQLLSSNLLLVIDKNVGKEITMIDLEYAGMDVVFMGVCFITSLFFLIILESNVLKFKKNKSVIVRMENDKIRNSIHNSGDKSLNYSEEESYNTVGNLIDENPQTDNCEIKKISNLEKDIERNSNLQKNSILVKNLVKNYNVGGVLGLCQTTSTAVNNLSFDLKFGECFALLGVTGAGKTSTFKCLTAETQIDQGFVEINGIRLNNNFGEISNLIGYCPQKDAIFDYMSVYENLSFYARIKGLKEDKEEVINNLITEMNLDNYRNKISGNLSGGNKRKLSVAIALIGNPPIILLDEPSTGMDPEARRFMWAVIYKISTRNKLSSVILTTHSMEEAETLCSRIGIMVDGEFKCLGSNQFIKDKFGDSFEISYTIKSPGLSAINDIFTKAFPQKTEEMLEDLIYFADAEKALQNLSRKPIYKEIMKSFIFNEFEDKKHNVIDEKISVSVKSFCMDIYYIDNILRMGKEIMEYFEFVNIIYVYKNNVKLKLPKSKTKNDPTIGCLLGLLEEKKKDLNISEFSITQTSLEQIFNKFASEKETVLKSNLKEVCINKGNI